MNVEKSSRRPSSTLLLTIKRKVILYTDVMWRCTFLVPNEKSFDFELHRMFGLFILKCVGSSYVLQCCDFHQRFCMANEFVPLFAHLVFTRFRIGLLCFVNVFAVLIVLACVFRMSESLFSADCF